MVLEQSESDFPLEQSTLKLENIPLGLLPVLLPVTQEVVSLACGSVHFNCLVSM